MDSRGTQSSSSSRRICKYDVFLSFRRADTRKTFADHLYTHLMRKGVFAFKDDTQLQKGESISPQLRQAVEDSRVSIVVFSKDYVGSTCCLEELTAIAECKEKLGQTVLPVFYTVAPSDVRHQNGDYEEAFALHTANVPDRVDRWKSAMTSVAESVGWDVRNKPEFAEIEKIVQEVVIKLDHRFSGIADDLVGIQSHIEELENLLKLGSEYDDFHVLGIWGMGSIGKTAHAKILFDRISHQFDASCFIEDINKIYKDGASAIQKQILCQTLDEKNLESYDPLQLAGVVRNRLSNKKVLVVLDNVDKSEQLEKLAINSKVLGIGSRVIITTRNQHILKWYKVEEHEVYKVPLLTDVEAIELFYKKAFKSHDPSSGYEELISEVLNYADHLPLAIRVLGSFLYSRDTTQWRGALDRMREYPEDEIMKVLQTSYEELDHTEKEIFLDSACFFTGKEEDYVKRILHCCELHPHIGIPVMKDKSLVTIDNQKIQMHKMLQELGKKIVRGDFHEYPELWNRLWRYEDFYHVMTTELKAIHVKALVLDQEEDVAKWSPLNAEEFSKMQDLRLLILNHNNFSGNLKFLSNNLQYLSWHGYPFTTLPSSFQPLKLVELNMPRSSIKRLWEDTKPLKLPKLRRVDLSYSMDLVEEPNFGSVPSPEIITTGCTRLEDLERLHLTGQDAQAYRAQVHPSIDGLRTHFVGGAVME